jgi:transporter family-2 protein
MVIIYKYINGEEILPSITVLKTTEWWMYIGGFLGAFYIIATILSASKIGYTKMFSLVICGQILLSTFFDHYGIMSSTITSISLMKGIGVGLLIISTFIIQIC